MTLARWFAPDDPPYDSREELFGTSSPPFRETRSLAHGRRVKRNVLFLQAPLSRFTSSLMETTSWEAMCPSIYLFIYSGDHALKGGSV